MADVVFVHPITGQIDTMPLDMVRAYVSDADHLRLEEAAKLACERDIEAADNLLLSFREVDPMLLSIVTPIPEGKRDEFSVEAIPLR